ncbi:hypothetical protein AB0K08_13630 [Citricoccus sp. NPDC055426]|uniref:HNH endonuclease n=1 Tax=Citricoccus sp. NPDC055426 TaxID=3155536 RepID=UPI003432B31D
MAWLKTSDTSANHPIALAVLEEDEADDRILNEVWGFAARCAVMSAQHEQDYIVTIGTAKQMAGSLGRYHVLTAAAVRAGYFTRVEIETEDGEARPAFKLVEDNDLFHMILKDERAWTNQRKRDTGNTNLTVPIRERDGDGCRWCGQVVVWSGDRKSGRSGTYDHLIPGEAARSPEDMVVACRSCNGARGDDEDNTWDKPLLAVPESPYYSKATVTYLAKHGRTVKPSERRKAFTPAPAAATGKHASVETMAVETPTVETLTAERPSGTAPVGGAPVSGAPARAPEEAPSSAVETGGPSDLPGVETPPPSDLPDPADQRSTESGFVGTGRDGSGLAGKGLGGAGSGRAGMGLAGGTAGSGGSHQGVPIRKKRRGKRGKR